MADEMPLAVFAHLCGVTTATARRWIYDGLIPARHYGTRRFVQLEDAATFLTTLARCRRPSARLIAFLRSVRPSSKAQMLRGFNRQAVLESVRLLLEEEQYSLSDVAMMFEVSVETVRQWSLKNRINFPRNSRRGLFHVRIWSDRENRFRPVPKASVHARSAARRAAQRDLTRQVRKAVRIALVKSALEKLRGRLGREPLWSELAKELLIHAKPTGGRLISFLESATISRIGMTEARRRFCHATGYKPWPVGGDWKKKLSLHPFEENGAR